MTTFSISEAKKHFVRAVREVESGGTVTLTRRGKPVAIFLSKAEFDRLQRRKRRIDWGDGFIDTRGFKFDPDEANRR